MDEPDSLLLEVSGSAHLFGGERALLDQIELDFESLGHETQIAIAPNPKAAWALSHLKPGICVDEPNLTQILSPLPTHCLRLSPKSYSLLEELKIQTISELLNLPRAQLFKRLGRETLQSLDQLMGSALTLIENVPETQTFKLSQDFTDSIRTSETLERFLSDLLRDLCQKLESASIGATQIRITLTHVTREQTTCTIGTATSSHEHAHLDKLLKLKITQFNLGLGIDRISLEALETAPIFTNQTTIPGCHPGLDLGSSPNLSAWKDLITNKIGPEALFQLIPTQSHLPERAQEKQLIPQKYIPSPHPTGTRPLRLLDPPEPIAAMALLPDNPPAQIRWRGSVMKVVKADGPERIECEWWRDPAPIPARDYYRVENKDGLRLWVYKQGSPPKWFVHGLFA